MFTSAQLFGAAWRLLLAGSVTLIGAAAVGQRAAEPARQQAAPPAAGSGFYSNFTGGEVTVVDSSEMRSSRIRFEAGARTNWHVHSEPQLLWIEAGQGRLQELGGPIRVLEAGAPVVTQANVPHWHGAAPAQAAVQFSLFKGTLEWQRPVTDAEYLGR